MNATAMWRAMRSRFVSSGDSRRQSTTAASGSVGSMAITSPRRAASPGTSSSRVTSKGGITQQKVMWPFVTGKPLGEVLALLLMLAGCTAVPVAPTAPEQPFIPPFTVLQAVTVHDSLVAMARTVCVLVFTYQPSTSGTSYGFAVDSEAHGSDPGAHLFLRAQAGTASGTTSFRMVTGYDGYHVVTQAGATIYPPSDRHGRVLQVYLGVFGISPNESYHCALSG